MCREFLGLSAFFAICAGRQWSIMPEFSKKVNCAIFTKKIRPFCAKPPIPIIGTGLLDWTAYGFYSHCRPLPAGKAEIRRSVPIWKIFLLKAGGPSAHPFSRNVPFTRSGPICFQTRSKANQPYRPGRAAKPQKVSTPLLVLIGILWSNVQSSRQKLIEVNTNSDREKSGRI